VTEPAVILSQPIRLKVLACLLGRVGLVLSALTLGPWLVALINGSWVASLRYLLVIAGLGIGCWPLARWPLPATLRSNEGLAVTALVFFLAPTILAYPLSGAGIPYAAALFEAVSAITTTGLSTLPTVQDKPYDFLFARAWMQWCGGLGFVALLPLWLEPGPLARHLLAEAEGEFEPFTAAWIYTRRMVVIYLLLTLSGFFLLWFLGGDGFAALVHTLAAISTGGFSSFDRGIAELGWPFASGVIAVSVLGAMPFAAYLRGSPWRDLQARALLLGGVVGGGLISVSLVFQGYRLDQALFHGLATAFSAHTTSGFATLTVEALPPVALGLLLGLMFIGGGLGSTAGGVKTLRFLLLASALQLELRRASLPPHAWVKWQLNGHVVEVALVCRVQAIIFLYLLTAFVSWLPFLALGYDPLHALFEVISALATVGLSSGITGPELPGLLQFVLELDMWLGRVEILAGLLLFYPASWRFR
jgi:trk system potassium uptake protein TrkH